jgi:histidinol dehydrogenase
MLTPIPKNQTINPLVLAAAFLCGVKEIYTIGGAHAIAAVAYGTPTIKKVNKIVGPGNAYVAEAKRQVFGQVGIDMIAGPSEILIICDGLENPRQIAIDLCSQAEHDENARAFLISPNAEFLEQVKIALNQVVPQLSRSEITQKSLEHCGALILAKDIDEAIEISNQIAPEHLMITFQNARNYLDKITNAGAIFINDLTPEVIGDYVAGPSHVLPTAGSAKFSSPLGVYDFQKKSSIISCNSANIQELACQASILARGEHLTAHALSAEARIKKDV